MLIHVQLRQVIALYNIYDLKFERMQLVKDMSFSLDQFFKEGMIGMLSMLFISGTTILIKPDKYLWEMFKSLDVDVFKKKEIEASRVK